jgi:NAD(P)-dependent dehydrogenase (short-subunit alcohol dehydrogenase family)
MSRLESKVCLVTGVGSSLGLGYATACAFAREGAQLVITDIDEAKLADRVAEIEAAGGRVAGWRQDVTSEQDWQHTMAEIQQRFDRLDVLVNNAGIAMLKPLQDFSLADYERQMSVNMTSVFLGTQAAVAAMRESGGGSIINMSSTAGLVGVPGVSVYSASKAGVRLFSKTVALECARDGIRCNTVHPGLIDTDMQQVAKRDNREQYDFLQESVPMGRMGAPADVANCVLFLASDESAYVTGAELVVDGGLTAQ